MARLTVFSLPGAVHEQHIRIPDAPVDVDSHYEYSEQIADTDNVPQWVYLEFDEIICAPDRSLVIGAKFDMDVDTKACRLAFFGRIVSILEHDKLRQYKIFKKKEKCGFVERIDKDGTTAICVGLFKKDSDLSPFVGMQVRSNQTVGRLESSFGKGGKCKVSFHGGSVSEGDDVVLQFKKSIFTKQKIWQ
jgi:hypothetical protein